MTARTRSNANSSGGRMLERIYRSTNKKKKENSTVPSYTVCIHASALFELRCSRSPHCTNSSHAKSGLLFYSRTSLMILSLLSNLVTLPARNYNNSSELIKNRSRQVLFCFSVCQSLFEVTLEIFFEILFACKIGDFNSRIPKKDDASERCSAMLASQLESLFEHSLSNESNA